MIKAVVFDLDGTLLDTIPDIAGSLNRALTACGLPAHPVQVCRQFVGGGIREAVRKAAPENTPEETLEKVLAVYLSDYPNHCTDTTRCYSGVPELLAGLEGLGLPLGVLRNKTEASTRKIIETLLPGVPFRFVFGRVDGRPLKPDPAAAAPVLEALAPLTPQEIAYVGDSGTDMTFARSVGMTAAAAPWGYRTREELVGAGAELAPDSPAELLRLLASAAPGRADKKIFEI